MNHRFLVRLVFWTIVAVAVLSVVARAGAAEYEPRIQTSISSTASTLEWGASYRVTISTVTDGVDDPIAVAMPLDDRVTVTGMQASNGECWLDQSEVGCDGTAGYGQPITVTVDLRLQAQPDRTRPQSIQHLAVSRIATRQEAMTAVVWDSITLDIAPTIRRFLPLVEGGTSGK